ncbi:MAG: DUF2779 domain-containing protein [Candidatus Saccharimonadia bacterium]
MQLSKSEYIMFLKHPAWLWLKKYDKTKLPEVDDNTQAIFDAGNLFETYAEQLFPGGVRVGFDGYNEYLSLPERTQKALNDGATTIFQGRFEYDQLTFICDVVTIAADKTVDLYEIKSSTKAKPDHIFDLAFQMVVLEGCGYTVRNIAVAHVNNQFVRNGDVDPKELTGITDVTEVVKAKRDLTKKHIVQALKVANSTTRPDISPSLARLGSLPDWLDIYQGLVKVEPGSIYDLCVIGAKNIGELEAMGITKIADIPDDFPLNAKQKLQVQATKRNQILLQPEKIKEYLASFEYPLYFFDYETLMSIVPYFDGIRPYQQVPFQYSLHVLDSPDAELRQVEYLHRKNSNPAEPLSKTLKSQIGTTGSVITWNMSFEKSCNTLLGSILPEYVKFYEHLNTRIVDLMLPFSNGWYVHKDFCGSASIKKVLPVMVPELSYKALGIQEGGSAQRLWMEAVLDGRRDGEKEQILSDLVEYCGLDTLAMVEIYKKLTNLIYT